MDMSQYVNPDDEYTSEIAEVVGKGIISMLGDMLLAPCMSNINENGFSISWDYSKVGQYYMWLCKKYNVDPDDDVVAALGLSTIADKSDIW